MSQAEKAIFRMCWRYNVLPGDFGMPELDYGYLSGKDWCTIDSKVHFFDEWWLQKNLQALYGKHSENIPLIAMGAENLPKSYKEYTEESFTTMESIFYAR